MTTDHDGSSIDLDEVLTRTVEAASLIPGVDATLVRASAHDGSTVGATTGLSDDAIERHVVSGPPDGSDVRAVSLSYLYPSGSVGRSSIRSGLAVPLFGEGDDAHTMYIVKHGTLRILSGSTILETVRDGGLVGEMAIIEEHMPRSATVIAGTHCEMVEIDVPRFLSLVANTPAFSITVLRVISRRLRVMNRRYRDSARYL